MSHCNEMICQHVTLSGYAERPKVADAVIEAVVCARSSRAYPPALRRPPRSRPHSCCAPGRARQLLRRALRTKYRAAQRGLDRCHTMEYTATVSITASATVLWTVPTTLGGSAHTK